MARTGDPCHDPRSLQQAQPRTPQRPRINPRHATPTHAPGSARTEEAASFQGSDVYLPLDASNRRYYAPDAAAATAAPSMPAGQQPHNPNSQETSHELHPQAPCPFHIMSACRPYSMMDHGAERHAPVGRRSTIHTARAGLRRKGGVARIVTEGAQRSAALTCLQPNKAWQGVSSPPHHASVGQHPSRVKSHGRKQGGGDRWLLLVEGARVLEL